MLCFKERDEIQLKLISHTCLKLLTLKRMYFRHVTPKNMALTLCKL